VINLSFCEIKSLNEIWNKICELACLNLKPGFYEEQKRSVKHSLGYITKANILIGYKPEFSFIKRIKFFYNRYKQAID
jgi:UDP-N-acetylglucosamine 4-epimerase